MSGVASAVAGVESVGSLVSAKKVKVDSILLSTIELLWRTQ